VSESIINEIQALQRMTVGQLRVEWERLYGETTRSRNRTYLWRRLAWRAQELQLGGLSESAKARIVELAPATFIRSQLPAGFRPDAKVVPTSSGTTTRRDPRLPTSGSTIARRYKGNDIRVLVLDAGFEWAGRRFDSLSEVAFAVTGSKWNGWLFFGLTGRKRSR
jgi:hypothetical protein